MPLKLAFVLSCTLDLHGNLSYLLHELRISEHQPTVFHVKVEFMLLAGIPRKDLFVLTLQPGVTFTGFFAAR